MTEPRSAIPPTLPVHFSAREGEAAGISRGRLRGRDLASPYRGVRSVNIPTTSRERVEAFAPRLRPGQFLSHFSAATLWGLPTPHRFEDRREIDVSVAGRRQTPPRAVGVFGHRMPPDCLPVLLDGIPVTTPIDTWLGLARWLDIDELIVLGDAVVSTMEWYPGRHAELVPSHLGQLREAVFRMRRVGGPRLRAALDDIRDRSGSPMESRARLELVRGGLPEPELNHPVVDSQGRQLGISDFVYERALVALEYEGDVHRSDPRQWRKDISRRERYEAAGWKLIRFTIHDLDPNPQPFINLVARTLRTRES